MTKNRAAAVELNGEPLEVVRHRYEVNGWSYTGDVLTAMNDVPRYIFEKPEEAPDKQPFAESHLKLG